jgi:predicted GNAT superfamily acetyltransferase
MTELLTSTARTDARQTADAAATRAGVTVVDLHDREGLEDVAALFARVWATSADQIMPVTVLRATAHAGCYIAGAYAGERMVGALCSFIGLRDGRTILASHILGVLPDARGGSVGYALKQDQRAWCLEHGITRMVWTFDPLVRRNAYFNLVKLGAVGGHYETNFYGAMDDGINGHDETDRLVAVWDLDSPRAAAAAALGASNGHEPERPEGVVLLDLDGDGRPVVVGDPRAGGETLLCRVPPDIVALRAAEPATGLQWRRGLRDTLGVALADGYVATGMTKSGWYQLTRREA